MEPVNSLGLELETGGLDVIRCEESTEKCSICQEVDEALRADMWPERYTGRVRFGRSVDHTLHVPQAVAVTKSPGDVVHFSCLIMSVFYEIASMIDLDTPVSFRASFVTIAKTDIPIDIGKLGPVFFRVLAEYNEDIVRGFSALVEQYETRHVVCPFPIEEWYHMFPLESRIDPDCGIVDIDTGLLTSARDVRTLHPCIMCDKKFSPFCRGDASHLSRGFVILRHGTTEMYPTNVPQHGCHLACWTVNSLRGYIELYVKRPPIVQNNTLWTAFDNRVHWAPIATMFSSLSSFGYTVLNGLKEAVKTEFVDAGHAFYTSPQLATNLRTELGARLAGGVPFDTEGPRQIPMATAVCLDCFRPFLRPYNQEDLIKPSDCVRADNAFFHAICAVERGSLQISAALDSPLFLLSSKGHSRTNCALALSAVRVTPQQRWSSEPLAFVRVSPPSIANAVCELCCQPVPAKVPVCKLFSAKIERSSVVLRDAGLPFLFHYTCAVSCSVGTTVAIPKA